MNKLKLIIAVTVSVAAIALCGYMWSSLGLWLSVIGIVLMWLVLLMLAILSSPKPKKVLYRVYVIGNDKFICHPSEDSSELRCIHKGKECIFPKTAMYRLETYYFYVWLYEIPYLAVEQSAKVKENVSPSDGPHSHL